MALITTAVVTSVALASGIDLHGIWHDRCSDCHGHAGDFARKYLSVSSNKLQGRHHVDDLQQFMRNHYLAENEVDAIYNMLLAQASNQQRFKDECGSCHGTAATFVRNTFELREGVLYSRSSGLRVRDFLEHHRSLEPNDVEFFEKVLTRVAQEIYRP